jgi:hypothetical protein
MQTHLYLSLTPESLVMSMLPPAEFGPYLAIGTEERARGPAMFFDLKPGFASEAFDLAEAATRCVPYPDGRPKRSVYLAVYRVLERVPLDAVNSLWLITPDGRVLALQQAPLPVGFPGRYHLYRELCPLPPIVASSLPPDDFCRYLTDPAKPVSAPRLCFVELELGGLADDPRSGATANLPYWYLEHLRDCLLQVQAGKATKTVERLPEEEFHYRCVKNGFFLGDQTGIRYFPFPARDQLETDHYVWWRSANI